MKEGKNERNKEKRKGENDDGVSFTTANRIISEIYTSQENDSRKHIVTSFISVYLSKPTRKRIIQSKF
jgi:hypothetical protein